MYAPVTNDIAQAARIIKEGRVVAVPTGTSYGLAADALQGFALQRVRNLKQRPADKSFTVFLRPGLWSQYLRLTPEEKSLLERYSNQPLTLLVEPAPPLVHLAQAGRVGLRVIDHPLMAALAEAVDVPLTATSANVSAQPPCADAACVQAAFPLRQNDTAYDLSLGCILDGGPLPATQSTIAKLNEGRLEIVRDGVLKLTL